MKQASRLLCCTLLALLYVFSYAGFGIHTCHDDGSRHFVWMLGDVSCEHIHHHSHGEDHDHHHDDGCCSTQVYVLTDAQDSDSGDSPVSAPEAAMAPVFEAAPAALACHVPAPMPAWNLAPPKPPVSHALLSVWLI